MDVERLSAAFEENFASRGELGASVCVWQDGREVISFAGGWRDRHESQPWTEDTPVLVWSATKGPAAACVLHAMEACGLNLMTRVADVWPEFAAAGKEEITFAQALSHSAGLPVLDVEASIFDHGAVAEAIAAQAPHWTPGTGHGYAPRLFGYFLDEVVRRLSGATLGAYWRTHFAEPLGLDFWIGLPTEHLSRVASIFPAKSGPPKGDRFYTAFATPGSFTIRAFGSPAGLQSVAAMNSPEARVASLPGFGGIGTARALAKFYAMLANGGALDGRVFFQQDTLAWMSTPLAQGDDRVLLMDTAFSAGFQCGPVSPSGEKTRALFGPSRRAFGHPGAGGSHAFADPDHRIAFAYVMNQMEPGVMPGTKAFGLIEALYS